MTKVFRFLLKPTIGLLLIAVFFPVTGLSANKTNPDELLQQAAKGDLSAQYSLAKHFEKAKENDKAYKWYKKASDAGHRKAQSKLGYFYLKGIGTSKDPEKAYGLLYTPAVKGYVEAQYHIGLMHQKGIFVKADINEAMTWYRRSALAGYSPSKQAIKTIENENRRRKQKAEEKRIAAQKKAAAKAKKEKIKRAKKKARPVKKTKSTAQVLMEKNWFKKTKPLEYLPSHITNCENPSNKIIECHSDTRARMVKEVQIEYITKSIIYNINNKGEFKIAYRNNVLNIDNTDQSIFEENTGIKLGWQETEHQLDCKIKKGILSCVKNKIHKLTLDGRPKKKKS